MNENIMVRASIETVQDIHARMGTINGLCRDPITDDEIKGWQEVYDALNNRHYIAGARIKTPDFSEEELAMYHRVYNRYPGGMMRRTPDISDEEVKGWQEAAVQLETMNLDEIRKKVQFFGGEEPVLGFQDRF